MTFVYMGDEWTSVKVWVLSECIDVSGLQINRSFYHTPYFEAPKSPVLPAESCRA